MKKRRASYETALNDIVWNTLLGFVGLFVCAVLLISITKKEQETLVRTEGQYAVVIRWIDGSADDVDLYVRDPKGNIAYFQNRDVGLMHLEHDDLGKKSDSIQTKYGNVAVEKNEERIILRGVIPGEYAVNVHMYNKEDPKPTAVTVILYRLEGDDKEVVSKERVLVQRGDESTAFRFSIKEDGSFDDKSVNEIQRRFVGRAGQDRRPPGGGFSP
jgi:hypothetical protein